MDIVIQGVVMKYRLLWPRLTSAARSALRGASPRWIEGRLSKPAFSRATIATRISVIALTLAVPLNLVIVAVFWQLSERASEVQRTGLVYLARTMAAAFDAQLGKYITVAQALASSPALLDRDLDAFEKVPGSTVCFLGLARTDRE